MTVPRSCIVDALIELASTGYLGDSQHNLIFNAKDQYIHSSDTTSVFQMGKITSSGYGLDGFNLMIQFGAAIQLILD